MYKAIKENKIIAVNDSGKFPCLVFDEVVEDSEHNVSDYIEANGEFVLKNEPKGLEVLAEEKRAIRNQYLTDADKYMIPDFPVSDEERALWIKYREYLRNITKDPKFPNVDVLNFKNWKEQIHDKGIDDAE